MALTSKVARLRAFATTLLNKNISMGKKSLVYSGSILETNLNGNIKLGKLNIVHSGVILQTYGGTITTGDCCNFNPYVVIYGHGGVTIGNNVSIATHSVLVSFNHDFSTSEQFIQAQGVSAKGIVIEDDVWIGAGVVILDGVTIAKGCVIGAGAVVSKSTEVYGVYVGVPAKFLKKR
jgi:acetyltransferase-like isoleucine patch superfamily enzyme